VFLVVVPFVSVSSNVFALRHLNTFSFIRIPSSPGCVAIN